MEKNDSHYLSATFFSLLWPSIQLIAGPSISLSITKRPIRPCANGNHSSHWMQPSIFQLLWLPQGSHLLRLFRSKNEKKTCNRIRNINLKTSIETKYMIIMLENIVESFDDRFLPFNVNTLMSKIKLDSLFFYLYEYPHTYRFKNAIKTFGKFDFPANLALKHGPKTFIVVMNQLNYILRTNACFTHCLLAYI